MSAGLADEAARRLEADLGPRLAGSETFGFDFTRYYEREMGPGLVKRFVAFARRIPPESLRDLKLAAMSLEAGWSDSGRRRVNLDPGYLTEAKVVLASRKDRGHRIWVGEGVFVEPTLEFRDGAYQPFPWTYPDYRTPLARDFFGRVRELSRGVGVSPPTRGG